VRYFEVIRRDGPARLGRLSLARRITTPGVLEPDDFISAGSVFSFESIAEALDATTKMASHDRLTILPFVPSPLHTAPPLEVASMDLSGPLGAVIHPFFPKELPRADLYILGGLGQLQNPRDLVKALAGTRERLPPDSAVMAPALATPWNAAMLVYSGVDMVDGVRMEMDGYQGIYHTRDGARLWQDGLELPCRCPSCQCLAKSEAKDPRPLLAAHNILKLEEELANLREIIRAEMFREHLEMQVRARPELTAALRLLDQEETYLERRTPTTRRSTLLACSAESLQRAEVKRFANRVLTRYKPVESDVLLLLPCSARKPYSTSRSHRFFSEAIGPARRFLHEVILTSPLAVVPRELEEAYPAASYDVPVTGRWDLEERAWLVLVLDAFLKSGIYTSIVAHLEGELEETVKEHGIDAVFTGGGTGDEALVALHQATAQAVSGARKLPDPRLRHIRAMTDFSFGRGAGETLMSQARIKGRSLIDQDGEVLARETLAGWSITLNGAERLLPLDCYQVSIGSFVPRGSLLAPGVDGADPQIRPGDTVLIRGEKAFGIGKAKMSGWEMEASHRGVAVEIRQLKEL